MSDDQLISSMITPASSQPQHEVRLVHPRHRPSLAEIQVHSAKISDNRAEISHKRTEIKRLEQQIQALQNQLDPLIVETNNLVSFLAPIRRLPFDILSHIAIIGARQIEPPISPFILAETCSLWRETVMATKKLWTQITFVKRDWLGRKDFSVRNTLPIVAISNL